jgi:regulator of replication initiation timing
MLLAFGVAAATAQQPSSSATDTSLAQSVQELREQVQELRTAVAEMKSEASEYRAESEELRKELEKLRTTPAASGTALAAPAESPNASSSTDQRLAAVEENSQLLASEIQTQYQTKVESASKYRVRLSGLVLMNLFRNSGLVDNQDFPTYAANAGAYGRSDTFGATMRQSELGLEVFGPQIAGAKSSGQVQIDFGGGFPTNALNGVNTGLVRMRTASLRLDWDNTSVIAGQENLFISPNSPTSYASLAIPALGYSGNLWAWTPQLRVEHRLNLTADQWFLLQLGILDNVTGEPTPAPTAGAGRLPTYGESTAQPAYAGRTSWTRTMNGRPLTFGASGYVAREHYGPTWDVTGWAATTDWRVPVYSRVEFSGELYRGLAAGGIGGGIGQSVLFSANAYTRWPLFRPLNSAGGWSQLKFIATPRLEFNGAFGMDSPFSSDIHSISMPVGYYPQLLTSNRSEMANFIFRPRSDLLFSGEYRHLRTSTIGTINAAEQVNVAMGVLF